MKPPAIFALIVRGLGAYMLFQAIHTFAGAIAVMSLDGPHMPGFTNRMSGGSFITVGVLALGAVWFLYGAPPIQTWAYPIATDLKGEASPKPQPTFTGPQLACVSCETAIPVGTVICPS